MSIDGVWGWSFWGGVFFQGGSEQTFWELVLLGNFPSTCVARCFLEKQSAVNISVNVFRKLSCVTTVTLAWHSNSGLHMFLSEKYQQVSVNCCTFLRLWFYWPYPLYATTTITFFSFLSGYTIKMIYKKTKRFSNMLDMWIKPNLTLKILHVILTNVSFAHPQDP